MGATEALRADPVTAGRVSGDRAVRDVFGQTILRHPDRRLLLPRATATARVDIAAFALDISPAVGGAPCRPVS